MKAHRLLIGVGLLTLALFFLAPLYVMLTTSLKSMDAVRAGGLLSLPTSFDTTAWAKAWGQKDMARYFAAYTSSFAGPDRQSRAKWESDRQVRIVSKKSISVVVNHLKIEVNDNKATAQFQQIYESDNFKGNSRKTLEMVKNGERWLIARETVN